MNAFTATWPPVHSAYSSNLELLTTSLRCMWDQYIPGGDLRKAMEAVYKLASVEQPPLHFLLRKDVVSIVRTKTSAILADTEKYKLWSEGLEMSM